MIKALFGLALLSVTADNPDALSRHLFNNSGATATAPAVRLDPPEPVVAVGPPPVPSLTSTDPVKRWRDTALAAGWPANLWYFVECTMRRESMGDPGAYNGRGDDRSYGLMQMNTKGALWGWYAERGLDYPAQLFNPWINLHYAWLLFQERDADPWSWRCR